MTEDQPMDRARFEALAEAYGGDLARWPSELRAAAERLLKTRPELSQVLAEAAELDAMLGASSEPVFSGVLRERIVATAPGSRSLAGAQRWLTGAGLADACLAGVLLGADFSDQVFADPGAEALTQAATSFGGEGDPLQLEEIG